MIDLGRYVKARKFEKSLRCIRIDFPGIELLLKVYFSEMTMDIEKLILSYPRSRPSLTPAHEAIYVKEYIRTRSEKNEKPLVSRIVSIAADWMHHRVASLKDGTILEIGAGALNHLKFEETAQSYDVVEPFVALYEQGLDKGRIRKRFDDIQQISLEEKYSRIISIAAFEHLTDLPFTIAKSGLLLEPEGRLQIAIPSEGGLGWGLAWRLTTGLAYKVRTGLNYKTLMRHEHVNQASEIVSLCHHFFGAVKKSHFPLPGLQLSVFTYLECSAPHLQRCKTITNRTEGISALRPTSVQARAVYNLRDPSF